jgi:hypothetical protein
MYSTDRLEYNGNDEKINEIVLITLVFMGGNSQELITGMFAKEMAKKSVTKKPLTSTGIPRVVHIGGA